MGRLIDADALIEFIENRYDITWADDYEGGIKDACTDILDKINAMPTIEQQQWIPCSERLPEKEDIYCVCFDESNLRENEVPISDAFWLDGKWQYGVLESYEHKMPKLVVEPIEELSIIAWMPLPECYKGES